MFLPAANLWDSCRLSYFIFLEQLKGYWVLRFMWIKNCLIGLFLGLCLPIQAHQGSHDSSANESDVSVDKLEDSQSQLWTGKVEAGFITSTGNSDSKVFNTAIDAVREFERWTHTVKLTAAGAAFNGSRSKEFYSLEGTAKYDLQRKKFLFANARYYDDKFDSFNEIVSAAGGAGFQPFVTDGLSWDVFAGIGYSHQTLEFVSEGEDDDLSGITFLGISRYSRQLTKTADLDFVSRVEYKPENTFARNEASLDVAINSTLALKIAYELRYNSDPARVDESLDTITKANIVYKF